MIEVLKQALEALEFDSLYGTGKQEAITSLRQAIKELESQEPVAWHLIEALYPQGERLDIRMGDGSILCNLLPQADGDLWWDGSGTGEKFIDPVYADVTHWRIHSNTHPPQRTWVGLTDGEICMFSMWLDSKPDATVFTAIEAKLKEKNT